MPELAHLIERYIAWRGGAAFEQLTSIHRRGTLETVGLTGPFETWTDGNGRFKESIQLPGFHTVTAFHNGGGWRLNASGQVEDCDPAEAEDARRIALLSFSGFLRGEAGVNVVHSGEEDLDGATWQVLRVSFGDADWLHFFLNADGACFGYRSQQDRREHLVGWRDWRWIDGVRVPFEQDERSEIQSSDARKLVTSVALNSTFDDRLFDRALPARIAKFPAGKSASEWIAFELRQGSHIYLPITISGTETVALLDTAAERTVLDKEFAASLHIHSQGEVTALGTGGAATASLAGGIELHIGGLTAANLAVAVIDLSQIAAMLGRPLPVVLGKELFNELIVDIDFEHRLLRFQHPNAFTPPPGAAHVAVDPGPAGIRSVLLSIEGGDPISVDFDLGNALPLLLYPSYWQPHGLLEGRPSSETLSGAVGGLRADPIVTLRDIEFAGATFHNVPSILTQAGLSTVDSDRKHGNLGMPIVSRFRLMTDFPRGALYLIPNDAASSEPFPKDRSGLITSLHGERLRVEFVAPGSPAAEQGWKTGEEIVAVDGQPVAAASARSSAQQWTHRADGHVELTLVDGSKRELALREYY